MQRREPSAVPAIPSGTVLTLVQSYIFMMLINCAPSRGRRRERPALSRLQTVILSSHARHMTQCLKSTTLNTTSLGIDGARRAYRDARSSLQS
ncbi:hypothetical protein PoB_005675900 [Plakobranchus ocellatus]|uniref:Uncharacterized protein n=1 Tax=Plakobranchus ocellatus TaxID=259542 RepID=A0AAV4CHI6_9GAST|nr:hypothetical protein PoB_005675900 [Plakobranchus ocellatus]